METLKLVLLKTLGLLGKLVRLVSVLLGKLADLLDKTTV
jgi:hypothetical protein